MDAKDVVQGVLADGAGELVGALGAEVDGARDLEVGEGVADDLPVYERLHAPRHGKAGRCRGALLGEDVVLRRKAAVGLVLVVDDHGLAVGVHVHTVDRARQSHARVLHLRPAAAEAPLKEPRLVAGQKARLVVQQG